MKMFCIPGRMPGMNEFINANRTNPHVGAAMKKKNEQLARAYVRQLDDYTPVPPVKLHYIFYEQNRRRDKDNVAAFAHKVIQDAIVREGYLENDGWGFVSGSIDEFFIDKENPRIEVYIIEEERKEDNG